MPGGSKAASKAVAAAKWKKSQQGLASASKQTREEVSRKGGEASRGGGRTGSGGGHSGGR